MLILALLMTYAFAGNDIKSALDRHGFVTEGTFRCMDFVRMKKCGELRTMHAHMDGIDHCKEECDLAETICIELGKDCSHHQPVSHLHVKVYSDSNCDTFMMCKEMEFKDQCTDVGFGKYQFVNNLQNWKCTTMDECNSETGENLEAEPTEITGTETGCVKGADVNGDKAGTHDHKQCVPVPIANAFYTRAESCPPVTPVNTGCTNTGDNDMLFVNYIKQKLIESSLPVQSAKSCCDVPSAIQKLLCSGEKANPGFQAQCGGTCAKLVNRRRLIKSAEE